MKGGTIQISWHDGKPVLTLDFHPISGLLATAGADYDIKVMQFWNQNRVVPILWSEFRTIFSIYFDQLAYLSERVILGFEC